MRSNESASPIHPSANANLSTSGDDGTHPVLKRALEAHRGDQSTLGRSITPSMGVRTPPLRYSEAFLGEARREGVTASEVRAALGSGRRTRSWDGCLLVQDWFQGVELTLDPSGRFGLGVRRTDSVN